jgi:hypothetical protein
MTGRNAVARRLAVGTALALTAGLGWIGTGAALAATPLVSCSSSGSISFTPGLTMSPTATAAKITGTLSSCTGRSGVKSGTVAGTIKMGPQTCVSVIYPPKTLGTGLMTVKWNGGTTSIVKVTLAIGNSDFSLTGPVQKNRFKGHKFSAPHITGNAVNPLNFHCKVGDGQPTIPIQGISYSGPASVN